MRTDTRSYTLPVTLTPAQKRDYERRRKELEAALELGYKGKARRITLSGFLKEARKRRAALER